MYLAIPNFDSSIICSFCSSFSCGKSLAALANALCNLDFEWDILFCCSTFNSYFAIVLDLYFSMALRLPCWHKYVCGNRSGDIKLCIYTRDHVDMNFQNGWNLAGIARVSVLAACWEMSNQISNKLDKIVKLNEALQRQAAESSACTAPLSAKVESFQANLCWNPRVYVAHEKRWNYQECYWYENIHGRNI